MAGKFRTMQLLCSWCLDNKVIVALEMNSQVDKLEGQMACRQPVEFIATEARVKYRSQKQMRMVRLLMIMYCSELSWGLGNHWEVTDKEYVRDMGICIQVSSSTPQLCTVTRMVLQSMDSTFTFPEVSCSAGSSCHFGSHSNAACYRGHTLHFTLFHQELVSIWPSCGC